MQPLVTSSRSQRPTSLQRDWKGQSCVGSSCRRACTQQRDNDLFVGKRKFARYETAACSWQVNLPKSQPRTGHTRTNHETNTRTQTRRHTRRRTPAQTNQPTSHTRNQPTPPVTHTLSARARRPAGSTSGSAPARAPSTDSSARLRFMHHWLDTLYTASMLVAVGPVGQEYEHVHVVNVRVPNVM